MKISATEALVTAVTTLGENHGDEIVPAIAVRLEFTMPPRMLNAFSRALLPALFDEQQIPRIPEVGTIHLKVSYEKAHTFIDAQEFKGCNVKKIQVEAREGFLIDVGLTVKIPKPTAAQRGQLTGLIKKEVKIVLESMQLRIDEGPEDGDEAPEKDARQPDLPGTEGKGKDGQPITPLLDDKGRTAEERAAATKH